LKFFAGGELELGKNMKIKLQPLEISKYKSAMEDFHG